MCGIVGYLNLNGEKLDSSKELIGNMCHTIAHRGPDEEGSIVIDAAALGMTRLSIIDLSTGQQPIPNSDESAWIVFNGEIYNYKEIRELLVKKGHTFKTSSDTESIVHLYEEFGVDCLDYLEGMFAFAIWDRAKQRLFIARDRMGEKPLHWGVFDGKFVFGSEIKGLLAHPSVTKDLNPEALMRYLALEYIPAPNSIFKGIHKLMPAHYMIVEGGNVTIKNYWSPKAEKSKLSEAEATERLMELLRKSIELRLISDVPLGIFLSGGIDSSAIAAIATEISGKQIKTFSVGFSDKSFDESDHALAVAKHIGSDHKVVTFEPDLAFETMTELWDYLDEPIADASIIPTYFLSKMTKESVTVALAGDGGDELFGGYPTYQAHGMADTWKVIPKSLRHGFIEPALRKLPVSLNNLSFDFKVKRFISAVDEPTMRRHLRWMGSFPLKEHSQLLNPQIFDTFPYTENEEELFDSPGSSRIIMPAFAGRDNADTAMRLDLSTYLPDQLLAKSDRASMAASLEVRMPFLAYPLVDFALSLPTSMKVNSSNTKLLLRRAVAPLLPEAILKRPKKGFGIPVGKWLKNEFRPIVDELLDTDFLRSQGIFQPEYVRALLKQHNDGTADRRKELWTLLQFQWWWRKFFMAAKPSELAFRTKQ
ncbi:MAG: asparagine synthase (glutamine-hydrolyzing) [Leptolyngbya sp.]|nr:asparagine synthase (glutamine-hydrolyzing) [Candidatus Melainabacteria bacterium]